MSCDWHFTAAKPTADCGLYAQVLGIDILMGCKGLLQAQCFLLILPCVLLDVSDIHNACAEPEKQFALVERHISRLRQVRELIYSQIIIMVERNLGFEAEHHQRALNGLPHTISASTTLRSATASSRPKR